MYKKLPVDKDTYITNRVMNSVSVVSSNVGLAGTLDLYKLHGVNRANNQPVNEWTRLLTHFDMSELKEDHNSGLIDINDSSFFCKVSLFDVYGGQPTPSNFTVELYPLSASFEEGYGKDVVKYSDRGPANWLTSSLGLGWIVTGSSFGGGATETCDYITGSSLIPSTLKSQFFKTGKEDLSIDVTTIVSATLTGHLPDSGFRISLTPSQESDQKTYFVKRFASKDSYDETKRPCLIYGYDDSVSDDTLNLAFDSSCSIKLYNSVQGNLQDLKSGSSNVSSDNCLVYKMSTNQPSGSTGNYELFFTGSQMRVGDVLLAGRYNVDIFVEKNSTIVKKLSESGSIKFQTSWLSLDNSLTYSKGEELVFFDLGPSSSNKSHTNFIVSVADVQDSYTHGESPVLRVNIFDQTNPLIKVVKTPVISANAVLKNAHYSVKDSVTNQIVIPKDDLKNSTKISSDSQGMFFKLYTSALSADRTYVIDIHTVVNGIKKSYNSASPIFKITRR